MAKIKAAGKRVAAGVQNYKPLTNVAPEICNTKYNVYTSNQVVASTILVRIQVYLFR